MILNWSFAERRSSICVAAAPLCSEKQVQWNPRPTCPPSAALPSCSLASPNSLKRCKYVTHLSSCLWPRLGLLSSLPEEAATVANRSPPAAATTQTERRINLNQERLLLANFKDVRKLPCNNLLCRHQLPLNSHPDQFCHFFVIPQTSTAILI